MIIRMSIGHLIKILRVPNKINSDTYRYKQTIPVVTIATASTNAIAITSTIYTSKREIEKQYNLLFIYEGYVLNIMDFN